MFQIAIEYLWPHAHVLDLRYCMHILKRAGGHRGLCIAFKTKSRGALSTVPSELCMQFSCPAQDEQLNGSSYYEERSQHPSTSEFYILGPHHAVVDLLWQKRLFLLISPTYQTGKPLRHPFFEGPSLLSLLSEQCHEEERACH